MVTMARLAWASMFRAPGRTLLRIGVLAASVALIGGMLLFLGNSLRTMSGSAVRSVPLDWQGPVTSLAHAQRVAAGVGRQAGVAQASPTATAPFRQATHSAAGSVTNAGKGSVLAVPPDYLTHIKTFRILQGKLAPGGVVLDQQMAATLKARIGDTVTLTPQAGAAPRAFRVSGVALVTAPDQLFQPLNPQSGPAPAQPPANVAVIPLATFAEQYAPSLRTITPASVGSSAQPGAQDGVQWQVQAQLDPGPLSQGSPGSALKRADRTRNSVERSLPGQVQFVDNLSDGLTTAANDALYAEALYIMLGLPGALIALGLAYLAALGTADRDRRDLQLMRARGATRRDLVKLALAEAGSIGLVAGLVGAAAAFLAVSLLVSGGAHLNAARAIVTIVVCVLVATAGAIAARVGVGYSRATMRGHTPLWQRLYLDVAAIAVSGLIYFLTARAGFSAVVNPDSNPTLSLSVYMFFAPALLWLGATLLLVRLRGRMVAWAATRAAGGRATGLRGFLAVSAGRRGQAINRGLIVVGLLLAYGVSLGIFSATYDQQAKVDAQLTLGADVVATAPPQIAAKRDLAGKIASVSGVKATTAVDHSYAYVGPDLQDTYGIDPGSFTTATTLRDSYFLGGSAKDMMSRLAKTRDGILVSRETVTDFGLNQGDLLKLRLLDHASGRFRVVPFHVVGVVQEFPSAPKDSFMVANFGYLQTAGHGSGPNVVFAKTAGDPTTVAHHVAAATKADGTNVQSIDQQTAKTSSSITTVHFTGISHIEEAFVILLAALAMALFVALAISERRVELATMAAVGAPLPDIGAFVWSEAALVLGTGMVLAAGLGWVVSNMLVAMLTHVFDPPPDALAIPWGFLAALGGAALLAAGVATALAARDLRRLPLGAVLREQ